jgi:hypothetical protein
MEIKDNTKGNYTDHPHLTDGKTETQGVEVTHHRAILSLLRIHLIPQFHGPFKTSPGNQSKTITIRSGGRGVEETDGG